MRGFTLNIQRTQIFYRPLICKYNDFYHIVSLTVKADVNDIVRKLQIRTDNLMRSGTYKRQDHCYSGLASAFISLLYNVPTLLRTTPT